MTRRTLSDPDLAAICDAMGRGLRPKQIADELRISHEAVKQRVGQFRAEPWQVHLAYARCPLCGVLIASPRENPRFFCRAPLCRQRHGNYWRVHGATRRFQREALNAEFDRRGGATAPASG